MQTRGGGKLKLTISGIVHEGLRSVRYAKEIENLDFVIANDLDPTAVEAIHRNREYNGVPETKLRTTLSDASFLMHKMRNDMSMQAEDRVDHLSVIDLDPYGGASPFLDSATSAICEGGMLAVTCTDLAVLCGNYAESCWAKYGAMPPKRTDYCHETALRIVLGSIASHAARHHRHIVPVMSMFADFYVRVFVRVYKHGGELKKVPSHMGYVMQCTTCDAREVQSVGKFTEVTPGNVKFSQGHAPVVDQRCPHCGGCWKMGGPLWMQPMHDRAFLERALAHLEAPDAASKYGTHKRMLGTITNMLDEIPDAPFFNLVSQLCNTLHLQTPKLDAFRSAIVSLGYKVSGSHCAPGAIKTNAPYDAVLDVLRSWHQLTPAKLTPEMENSPAYKILSKPPTRVASFEINPAAKAVTHTKSGEKIQKFPVHPPNWGPGSRAGRKRDNSSMAEELAERRKDNQGLRVAKKKSKLAEAAPSTDAAAGSSSTVRNFHSSAITCTTQARHTSIFDRLKAVFQSKSISTFQPRSMERKPTPSTSTNRYTSHSISSRRTISRATAKSANFDQNKSVWFKHRRYATQSTSTTLKGCLEATSKSILRLRI